VVDASFPVHERLDHPGYARYRALRWPDLDCEVHGGGGIGFRRTAMHAPTRRARQRWGKRCRGGPAGHDAV